MKHRTAENLSKRAKLKPQIPQTITQNWTAICVNLSSFDIFSGQHRQKLEDMIIFSYFLVKD